MSRTIASDLITAFSQDVVNPYIAVEFDLDNSPVRLWTGYGDRTIGVDTYIGAGNLLTISGFDEVNDLSAKSLTITVSGISSTIISMALQEPYQRRGCTVYLGTTDTSNPIEIFSGYINTMSIQDTGETSDITVTIESKLIELEKSSNRRYTEENHATRYSNDTFFSYVTKLQDEQVVWGREKV